MTARVLQRPTLVLNRNWQPIQISTVARVLVMLWNQAIRVVDPADFQTYDWADWSRQTPRDGDWSVRSASFHLRAPEVATLVAYDRLPSTHVPFSRRNLFKRDRYACQYCGVQPGSDALTIDHVWPRSKGGQSTWENCVLACLECNKRKADRTPEKSGMRLRRPPVRPVWKPLYAADFIRIASWSKFISEAYWNVELGQ